MQPKWSDRLCVESAAQHAASQITWVKIPILPFTVGRKNWLFSDTPTGAHASSRIYTMVEMAKAHSLYIEDYLDTFYPPIVWWVCLDSLRFYPTCLDTVSHAFVFITRCDLLNAYFTPYVSSICWLVHYCTHSVVGAAYCSLSLRKFNYRKLLHLFHG